MAIVNGFRLIARTESAGNIFYDLPHGMVDYTPKLLYRFEKKNAFDPTYIHRREPYHQDEFALSSPLTPIQYQELQSFLLNEGIFQLYIEYRSAGVLKQYPIEISSLPSCADDLHEHPAVVKFAAVSRYVGSPGYVNFDTFILADDAENIVL